MTRNPDPDPPEHPQTPPALDRENRVHFCQGGLATGGGIPPLGAMLPVFLPHVLIAVVAGFLVIADPIWPTWVPRAARLAVASAAVLVILGIACRAFWLAYRRATDISSLPMALDERARVNISCWNDQRTRLEQLGDTAFEPEQFRTFLPSSALIPSNTSARRRQTVAALLPSLVTVPIIFAFTAGTYSFVVVIWSAVVASLVWRYRRPTYLRVFPGRIEIRRYPTLGLGQASVETIDLRNQPVRLDLKLNALHVGEWTADTLPKVAAGGQLYDPQPNNTSTVRLWPIFGHRRAVELIYRATISTADAPAHELD